VAQGREGAREGSAASRVVPTRRTRRPLAKRRLTAFLLRRTRLRAGLTLTEAAKRLGAKSLSAYARYEQGRAGPTIVKLSGLLAAVAPARDFVIAESRHRA